MDARINEGYVITDSIHVGETEFVLGKMDSSIPMYVTWACKGGDNYYWGHYFSDPLDAKRTCWTGPWRKWTTRWSGGPGPRKSRRRKRRVSGKWN